MEFAAFVIFAYLLGSIPFGLIIAKAHGKNLRAIGSGNIGATNVSRALGKKYFRFTSPDDVEGFYKKMGFKRLTGFENYKNTSDQAVWEMALK